MEKLTAISLFAGGMGLDLGFEQAGFQIRAVVEHDRAAVSTIEKNRPNIPVMKKEDRPANIEDVSTEDLLKTAGLVVGEATVVVGAPPCEPYSTAGRRNGKQDHRADAVFEFIRVIREARPQFFVMEEVDSFLSASKKHIGFYQRIRMKDSEISADERLGSFFHEIMDVFASTGYHLSFDTERPKSSVLNGADFGVPQRRKRFILIGSRDGPAVTLPRPTRKKPRTLRQGLSRLRDREPEFLPFPGSWGQYISQVPPGGCWKHLPEELHRVVLGGAFDDPDNPATFGKKGGRTGFMRRLSWDLPSPTLTDSPVTKSSCLCHPDADRPLSVREYARLQGFPAKWEFVGSTSAKYRLIGQATPVALAYAIAKVIKDAASNRQELRSNSRTSKVLTDRG